MCAVLPPPPNTRLRAFLSTVHFIPSYIFDPAGQTLEIVDHGLSSHEPFHKLGPYPLTSPLPLARPFWKFPTLTLFGPTIGESLQRPPSLSPSLLLLSPSFSSPEARGIDLLWVYERLPYVPSHLHLSFNVDRRTLVSCLLWPKWVRPFRGNDSHRGWGRSTIPPRDFSLFEGDGSKDQNRSDEDRPVLKYLGEGSNTARTVDFERTTLFYGSLSTGTKEFRHPFHKTGPDRTHSWSVTESTG